MNRGYGKIWCYYLAHFIWHVCYGMIDHFHQGFILHVHFPYLHFIQKRGRFLLLLQKGRKVFDVFFLEAFGSKITG